jgi:UDP:flavonoid glycosyltransferase YjiC (YdhE family)
VIAGGGFSLLSEAVYLGKPILAVPLHGQFEQVMNARYVQRLGYGLCADEVDAEVLGGFIEQLPEFEAALAGYEQDGNTRTLATIAEVAAGAAAANPRDVRRARRTARKATR